MDESLVVFSMYTVWPLLLEVSCPVDTANMSQVKKPTTHESVRTGKSLCMSHIPSCHVLLPINDFSPKFFNSAESSHS